MQDSTEITREIDTIKALDAFAVGAVANAKANMQGALEAAKAVGNSLDALKTVVGSKRFDALIGSQFDEDFRHRAKSYRKAIKGDGRQGLLSLGVIPEKEQTDVVASLKADPFFGWVNKITGHLRSLKTLSASESSALRGLTAEVRRLENRADAPQ